MPKKLRIIELGNPILRQKARLILPAEVQTAKIQNLIDDMVFTCKAMNAVGLAAPQVGKSVRLIVIASRPTAAYPKAPIMAPVAMINPKVISCSFLRMNDGWEGCASVPGIRAVVSRSDWVGVSFLDRYGKSVRKTLRGFVARVFEHEDDHLDGQIFLDIAQEGTIITDREYKKMLKEMSRNRH